MKSKTNPLLLICTAVAIASLSSCAISQDEAGYRYEHGDRIAPDGRRDVGWCIAHASTEQCRSSVAGPQ